MKLKRSSAIGWLLVVISLQVVTYRAEETDRGQQILPKWANLALIALQKSNAFLNQRNSSGYAEKQQVYESNGNVEVEENVVVDGQQGSTVQTSSSQDTNVQQGDQHGQLGPAPSLAQQAILTTIATAAALVTLYESVYRRVGPQDSTPEDILAVVKRLESSLGNGLSQGQYKTSEDAITRAQHDMTIIGNGPIGKRYGTPGQESGDDASYSEDPMLPFQRFLWLERAREIDGNMILIMKGLLGQHAGAVDLMEAISKSTNCDAIAVPLAVNKFFDRIREGSRALEFFAKMGQMSEEEVHERRSIFWAYHAQVVDRQELLVQQCLEQQLKFVLKFRKKDKTEHVAKKIAGKLKSRYPLPTRWIIAVYRDQDMEPIPVLARADIKPKLSGGYVIQEGDLHVALYPFAEGEQPMIIDGRRIDEFCSRRIPGAGDDNRQCDVGSSDGEFVYDQLRRQGIVPPEANLIVVPSAGELSLKMVPEGSLNPFFSKRFPDFHIVAF